MSQFPPKYVERLLRLFFRQELWESIEGDLQELYTYEVEQIGHAKARWRYLLNALAFFRFHRLRQYSKTQNQMDLLKNYLKVSFRDIRRHRVFSAINLFGLVTGFTVLLLVIQFVLFETGFDQFNSQYDRTFRIINDRYQNGQLVQHGSITYPTIGPTLKKEYPEVEHYTRLMPGSRNYLHYADDQFLINEYFWVDEYFLDVLDYRLLVGNREEALKESASVVLTRSYAERLLAQGQSLSDLLGQEVLINDWDFHCKVTGVVEDLPAQSHIQSDLFISYKTFIRLAGEGADNSWQWSDFYHYIVLKPGVDAKRFEQKLEQFSDRFFQGGEVSGAEEEFHLQPLGAIHLDDSLEYEYARVVDGQFVWLILAIAGVIMLIAWINYINLTTSRALERAKEVGVRKAMGAYHNQIFGQFLTESILLNVVALISAIVLVVLLQPVYRDVTDLPLTLSLLLTSSIFSIPFPVIFLLGFSLVVLVIGIYPARLISRFRPEEVIKGKFALVGDLVHMRKLLVVAQFTAALILIATSTAIYRQISFMQSQDLGMNMSDNLVIYGPDLTDFDSVYIAKFESFRGELMSKPAVQSVTSTGRLFGDKMPRSFMMRSSADPDQQDITSNWLPVDYGFLDQFGIEVLAGRSFDRSDYHTNGRQVNTALINEAAIDQFKFKDAASAVGGQITLADRGRSYRIVGVVSNFHQRTLREDIEPILFFPFYDNSHFISIKYLPGMEEQAIDAAQEVFAKFYPGNYFDYLFLKDHFDDLYRADERIGSISAGLTIIAINLAVLGLYGLVLITLIKKTKEIGIRKVLGASLSELLGHFGAQFILLVGGAAVLGIPISYLFVERFLQDYSYNTGVEWWVILTAALSMVVLCGFTVLLQTRRISHNNPVESLRYE
ncbi:ABC transporter permease [Marinoscillum sp.]|uniref:ABC transporter permease n=1 Tax=Marinoscillum sp. TaxID=2024838 RepID=UPI003BAB8778